MPRGAAAVEERVDDGTLARGGWRTVLFNCDCHTFDEVERALLQAVRCTLARARQLSHEVHTQGSAVVCAGSRERCEAAADALGAVGLLVKVVE